MRKPRAIAKIQKRDGRVVPFKADKIITAIYKAGRATKEFDKKQAEKLGRKVLVLAKAKYNGNTPTVENIQDVVEEVLIKAGWAKTAKAYILYRNLHEKIRNIQSVVVADDLLEGYLHGKDWRIKENSNMAYSLQGLNNHISSTVSSSYWLNSIYPEHVKNAHVDGSMHIHDLQLLSVYCVGWDLQDLLRRGFGGVYGKVWAGPPKHFSSALGQLVNFFYTLQGECAGASAVSSFDTLLAPYIRFDKLDYKQVKQALQEFLYNMNVPTRVGFQTPFTNVTLDLTPPKMLGEEYVLVGGQPTKFQYKEFQPEMDLFNKAFAEVMTKGDHFGRVFTFPIPTYNITKDFNWDNPVLEPVWEMTAKYGIPYFSNFINSDMSPDDARSMCCRLRLDNRELRKRGGGYFGSNPLTGSIGIVTLNLPRIGFLAKDKKDFFKRLDVIMDTAKESLEIKRQVLEKLTDDGLYPYSMHYLDGMKAKFGLYWKSHFSTIGLVGMNEALINFMNADIVSEKGRAFAVEVLDHMRDRIQGYQKETGTLFNLEATPAEATSFRLAKADKKLYPDIKVANEKDYTENRTAPYYTNSTQLPVGFTEDMFEALDLQDDLQTRYTGGTVFHGFLGERISDAETAKKLVKKIAQNYHLPYYTLTPTFSVCGEHGYIKGEHFTCPTCSRDCEVYSRVVGYLRPIRQWNDGKRAEFADRLEYADADKGLH